MKDKKFRRKRVLEMIKKANDKGIELNFNEAEALLLHDPALQFDEEGRLIRWVKEPIKIIQKDDSCCANRMDELDE